MVNSTSHSYKRYVIVRRKRLHIKKEGYDRACERFVYGQCIIGDLLDVIDMQLVVVIKNIFWPQKLLSTIVFKHILVSTLLRFLYLYYYGRMMDECYGLSIGYVLFNMSLSYLL